MYNRALTDRTHLLGTMAMHKKLYHLIASTNSSAIADLLVQGQGWVGEGDVKAFLVTSAHLEPLCTSGFPDRCNGPGSES